MSEDGTTEVGNILDLSAGLPTVSYLVAIGAARRGYCIVISNHTGGKTTAGVNGVRNLGVSPNMMQLGRWRECAA